MSEEQMQPQIILNQPQKPMKDPPRREGRRRVRVRFRKELGDRAAFVAAHQRVKKADAKDGWVELVCYESDVEAISALVEDRVNDLARAREMYEREYRKHIAKNSDFEGAPEDIVLDKTGWSESMKHADKTFGQSVESAFFALTDRGVRPLEKVEISDDVLDPPMTDQEAGMAQLARRFGGGQLDATELATAMVEAMTKAGWTPPGNSGGSSKSRGKS